jgi:hypothetical protein
MDAISICDHFFRSSTIQKKLIFSSYVWSDNDGLRSANRKDETQQAGQKTHQTLFNRQDGQFPWQRAVSEK